MEGLLDVAPKDLGLHARKNSIISQQNNSHFKETAALDSLKQRRDGAAKDEVLLGVDSKALAVTIQKVLDKLNELLRAKLPEGTVQKLKPEEHTPERTASRIVDGIAGLFAVYAKQNSELEGEALLNTFMEQARKGVELGYKDAYDTLEGIGAFDVPGVKDGVEETRTLIDEKLDAFEQKMRKVLGIDPVEIETEVAGITRDSVLAQGGVGSSGLSIAA